MTSCAPSRSPAAERVDESTLPLQRCEAGVVHLVQAHHGLGIHQEISAHILLHLSGGHIDLTGRFFIQAMFRLHTTASKSSPTIIGMFTLVAACMPLLADICIHIHVVFHLPASLVDHKPS